MKPQPISELSGKYGAPMGRTSDNPDSDFTGLVYLEPILDPCPNACGAYDYGGAYWGCGKEIWRAVTDDGEITHYFRGASKLDSDEYIEKAARESGWESARFKILETQGGCKADDGEPCDFCYECEETERAEELAEQVRGCDLEAFEKSLYADNYTLVSLSESGELKIQAADSDSVELWALHYPGCGTHNQYWSPGDFPGGFEFCGGEKAPTCDTYESDSEWRYNGDVNIEHGGYYWRNDGSSSADYVLVVRVTPASAAGGADNAFLIESGSVYLDRVTLGGTLSAARESALSVCGYRLTQCGRYIVTGRDRLHVDSIEGRELLTDAFLAYRGMDIDASESIRLGKCESDSGQFLHEIDTVKPHNLNLRRYVENNYL